MPGGSVELVGAFDCCDTFCFGDSKAVPEPISEEVQTMVSLPSNGNPSSQSKEPILFLRTVEAQN